MARRKNKPDDNAKKGERTSPDLKALYAQLRKEFTAADLQKFTEIEPMVPFEQVLAKMEEVQQREEKKRKRK